ncbi:MAG TPA: HAD-IA family hydrolase [Pseudomonadales bacterium]|nr:HAD-IA family hydrolase [Pseudomonadales bacterium]
MDERFEAHERGELACDAFFEHLADGLGLALDADGIRAGWNAIFGPEVAGLEARLARLAAHRPLYVLSNTNAAHEAVFMARHGGLLAHMDDLYLSHRLGMRKPDPAIYHEVAARMGRAPGDILFLDDVPANLQGAAAAGLQTHHVSDVAMTPQVLDGWLSALEDCASEGSTPR